MKNKIESKFDKHGWKIVVEKTKRGHIKIAQRNKDSSIHMMHKPMQLRLRDDELNVLLQMLSAILRYDGDQKEIQNEK